MRRCGGPIWAHGPHLKTQSDVCPPPPPHVRLRVPLINLTGLTTLSEREFVFEVRDPLKNQIRRPQPPFPIRGAVESRTRHPGPPPEPPPPPSSPAAKHSGHSPISIAGVTGGALGEGVGVGVGQQRPRDGAGPRQPRAWPPEHAYEARRAGRWPQKWGRGGGRGIGDDPHLHRPIHRPPPAVPSRGGEGVRVRQGPVPPFWGVRDPQKHVSEGLQSVGAPTEGEEGETVGHAAHVPHGHGPGLGVHSQ